MNGGSAEWKGLVGSLVKVPMSTIVLQFGYPLQP
jgi:hypothetical protein